MHASAICSTLMYSTVRRVQTYTTVQQSAIYCDVKCNNAACGSISLVVVLIYWTVVKIAC